MPYITPISPCTDDVSRLPPILHCGNASYVFRGDVLPASIILDWGCSEDARLAYFGLDSRNELGKLVVQMAVSFSLKRGLRICPLLEVNSSIQAAIWTGKLVTDTLVYGVILLYKPTNARHRAFTLCLG